MLAKKSHYNSKTNINGLTIQISRAIQNAIFNFFFVRVHVNLLSFLVLDLFVFSLFFNERHVILLKLEH